ncbi:hypothetical protein Taro_050999 [Colocasia esculenta]|uniref:Uncharacterized protein n=1 Tax=Colocasia esculenta TaxID=4460 RepID=A0A843XFB5_COLES|nr:hypothetical protein [Colocasia esculenta]
MKIPFNLRCSAPLASEFPEILLLLLLFSWICFLPQHIKLLSRDWPLIPRPSSSKDGLQLLEMEKDLEEPLLPPKAFLGVSKCLDTQADYVDTTGYCFKTGFSDSGLVSTHRCECTQDKQ